MVAGILKNMHIVERFGKNVGSKKHLENLAVQAYSIPCYIVTTKQSQCILMELRGRWHQIARTQT